MIQRQRCGISTSVRYRHYRYLHEPLSLESIGGTLSHQTCSITYLEDIKIPASKQRNPFYVKMEGESRPNVSSPLSGHVNQR